MWAVYVGWGVVCVQGLKDNVCAYAHKDISVR